MTTRQFVQESVIWRSHGVWFDDSLQYIVNSPSRRPLTAVSTYAVDILYNSVEAYGIFGIIPRRCPCATSSSMAFHNVYMATDVFSKASMALPASAPPMPCTTVESLPVWWWERHTMVWGDKLWKKNNERDRSTATRRASMAVPEVVSSKGDHEWREVVKSSTIWHFSPHVVRKLSPYQLCNYAWMTTVLFIGTVPNTVPRLR